MDFNKLKYMGLLCLMCAFLFGFYYFLSCQIDKPTPADNIKVTLTNDEVKFKKEYEILNGTYRNESPIINVEIPDDNNIVYLDDSNIIDTLKNEKGIFYFGFDYCPWCRRMLPTMFESMKDANVETIYYYDFHAIRAAFENDKDSKEAKIYIELMDILGKKVTDKFEGSDVKRMTAPYVFAVDNGMVLGSHKNVVDSYTDTTKELTDEQKQELKRKFDNLFKLISSDKCDVSSAGC